MIGTVSNDKAREYFNENGLKYSDIGIREMYLLMYLIACKVDESRELMSYPDFEVNDNFKFVIKKDKSIECCYLTCRSSNFKARELVSFNRDGFIGFVGWADQSNTNPVIAGFIEWVDMIKDKL